MRKMIEEVCGEPLRQKGSHRTYEGPDGVKFTFSFQDGDELRPSMVQLVLTRDLGLTKDEARARLSR